MKTRTDSYIGTFSNNKEGLSQYNTTKQKIREFVKGGRFVKMFRGNHRLFHMEGNRKWYSGSSRKEGSTHFDVYLLDGNDGSVPKFFNFTLESKPRFN